MVLCVCCGLGLRNLGEQLDEPDGRLLQGPSRSLAASHLNFVSQRHSDRLARFNESATGVSQSLASYYQSAVVTKIILESLATCRHCAARLADPTALPAQVFPSDILLSLYIVSAHVGTSKAVWSCILCQTGPPWQV